MNVEEYIILFIVGITIAFFFWKIIANYCFRIEEVIDNQKRIIRILNEIKEKE